MIPTSPGQGRALIQFTESDTLLAYSLMTTPSPVQVSPKSGPASVASLTFVVSCPVSVGEAMVSQVAFDLPVGDAANPSADALTDTGGISASVSSSGADQWQIVPGASPGSFVLTPQSGQKGVVDVQGLTVSLTGIQVSTVVGTAVVKVVEQAQALGFPLQARTTGIAVPKFPYGFYAGNFAASVPQVAHGGIVTLTWVGSVNAAYTIFWGTGSQVVSNVRTWPSPPLDDTTTFILEATAQQDGQTVKQYFSTTVIVADPDVTATSLQVLTTSTLRGAVAVSADLSVSGAATAGALNGGALNVLGAGSMGQLMVDGRARIGTVQTGTLTIDDALTATRGRVAMLGRPVGLTPGSWTTPNGYRAQTDGYVTGLVGFSSRYVDGSMCWAYGTSGGVTVTATGGDVGYFGPGWSRAMGSNPNSFTLPVAAGNAFYVGVQQGRAGQQSNAPYWFYWVPLGAGQLEEIGGGSAPLPQPGSEEFGNEDRARWEFIAVLERIVGREIDEDSKQQLISSMRSL